MPPTYGHVSGDGLVPNVLTRLTNNLAFVSFYTSRKVQNDSCPLLVELDRLTSRDRGTQRLVSKVSLAHLNWSYLFINPSVRRQMRLPLEASLVRR